MMKGKVVFEVANVGSKSEGKHPFLVMEDGKKVKLGLLGDNPFMHTKLKAYDQKNVIAEGEFNDNGKFVATNIQEDNPEDGAELKAVDCVEREQYIMKAVNVDAKPCCEPEVLENTPCEATPAEETCCDETCCCDEQEACEEKACECEKQPCEE